jgi:hypothetical protein
LSRGFSKVFEKFFGFDYAIVEPMRESLFTSARSPKVLRSTVPLDYTNIIPQGVLFVKRKREISFRQFAQTFGQKRCEMQHFAQKRHATIGRAPAKEKEVTE